MALSLAAEGLVAAVGVRTDTSLYVLTGYWQLLDRYELEHHLASSLWQLHLQPPLYNLLVAGFLHLPSAAVGPAMIALNCLLGVVLVASSFLLGLELGLGLRWSFLLGAVVACSPSVLLYENWEFYTFPSAALLALTCWLGARAARTRRLRPLLGCFFGAAGVVLLNSTFQWPWLVALVVVEALVYSKALRRTLVLGALPLLLVLGWYAKDALVFHSFSTSSMLGMNLAKTTLLTAKPATLSQLVAAGKLSPIALLAPFQPVSAYEPAFARPSRSPSRLLREVEKRDGAGPNLDNAAEITISAAYLHADLAYIQAEPGAYLASVWRGVRLWLVPSEQYSFLDANEAKISSYDSFVDRFVEWQPSRWDGSGYTPPTPSAAQLSWGAVLVSLLCLLGLPLLAWRRRRARAEAAALALVWVTIAYAFLSTSLIEYGENNRFRFDLGALPLLGALVVALAIGRELRRRRLSGAAAPPG